jgi:hypothetical protein
MKRRNMKRISTLAVGATLALASFTTPAKAFDALTGLVVGAVGFGVGSYYGKKWEREDPRRNRVIMQPVQQPHYQDNTQYVSGPSGMYYYQPTMYTYEPQRVIIRDSY